MSHNTFDPCNDLVTRLTAANSPVAEEHAHELLDTELAREVLEAIVGGLRIGGMEAAGQFKECSATDGEWHGNP